MKFVRIYIVFLHIVCTSSKVTKRELHHSYDKQQNSSSQCKLLSAPGPQCSFFYFISLLIYQPQNYIPHFPLKRYQNIGTAFIMILQRISCFTMLSEFFFLFFTHFISFPMSILLFLLLFPNILYSSILFCCKFWSLEAFGVTGCTHIM